MEWQGAGTNREFVLTYFPPKRTKSLSYGRGTASRLLWDRSTIFQIKSFPKLLPFLHLFFFLMGKLRSVGWRQTENNWKWRCGLYESKPVDYRYSFQSRDETAMLVYKNNSPAEGAWSIVGKWFLWWGWQSKKCNKLSRPFIERISIGCRK